MLNRLKEMNPNIPIFSVDSEAFSTYGRVLRMDTAQILEEAQKIPNPQSGASYVPQEESFAQLPIARQLQDCCFGTLPTQVGYCWGHNSLLNAAEWHCNSEVNIAVTPMVLILGHVWDMREGKIDSADFQAFYLPAGTAVEMYATTLHFTPCEVSPDGFGCVVALPVGTNVPLDAPTEDPLLFRKNKWIVAHVDNQALLDRGVKPGITGCNYCIEY